MKTLPLLIAALMLALSAPVSGAISIQSPQELARNMDDVQSLGVIYINRHSEQASQAPETEQPPAAPTWAAPPEPSL